MGGVDVQVMCTAVGQSFVIWRERPQINSALALQALALSASRPQIGRIQLWSVSLIPGEFYWICANTEPCRVALQSCSSMGLAARGPRSRCICCTPPHAAGRVAERWLRRRCAEHASTVPPAPPCPRSSSPRSALSAPEPSCGASWSSATLGALRPGQPAAAEPIFWRRLGARMCGMVIGGSHVWPQARLPLLVAPATVGRIPALVLEATDDRFAADLPAQNCRPSAGLSTGSGLRAHVTD